MDEKWELDLSITFPILVGDVEQRLPDDNEIDFRSRALQRVRPRLEELLEKLGPDSHYHLGRIQRCID